MEATLILLCGSLNTGKIMNNIGYVGLVIPFFACMTFFVLGKIVVFAGVIKKV